ncbi:nuclear transport factor 2 family protein [Herbaspirillum sp. LeCh32-8]|uniref:nuclear transport factor 2 family protein n=1 Tax=Herbaspirillum sp. LeCh32-8 TaxID=2821356 RepID=UPI001AE34552|nr:nuclear transport factor 2 family protein [Herbaspirillum sp. LeCh32-8]MBP0600737.1 nuclear transport factor 2 family protein [Herbaspirillum sp. LeCh32-8]
MKTANQLLQAYLDNVQSPEVAGELFATDGVLELPWVKARVQGPQEVSRLITGILKKIPDFRLVNPTVWIDTPERVFAEYHLEALVVDTGKVYKQTYAGLLIAENGKC